MKVIILSILFLLISNVFIFSSEVSEEVIISNESNRYDLSLMLKSETQFGAFSLTRYYDYDIYLYLNMQIINSTEIVLKKVHINGVSAIKNPIYARNFIDGINDFHFSLSLFEEGEEVNKIRQLAETNGIDVYVECFDEINNEKKNYSFRISRENSIHFYNAVDMIFRK
ncbi:hypothetical protein [Borreliella lusitaniae]|uniref:Uncharacterized protein n=1 Tax=Borreliella lusitaniae TaxID=100177 RepID=A0ACD5GMG1_9SPIR